MNAGLPAMDEASTNYSGWKGLRLWYYYEMYARYLVGTWLGYNGLSCILGICYCCYGMIWYGYLFGFVLNKYYNKWSIRQKLYPGQHHLPEVIAHPTSSDISSSTSSTFYLVFLPFCFSFSPDNLTLVDFFTITE